MKTKKTNKPKKPKASNTIESKRKDRKKQTAEDFTPSWLVNQMLDKLNEYGPESWEEDKTFLDPACGNGNMLVCVLQRKLGLGHDPTKAIDSVYGTDIMQDNIKECRLRLLKVLHDNDTEVTGEHIQSVFNNIVCTPLSNFKNGSLDYDFCFRKRAKRKDIERWLDGVYNQHWFELIGKENINEIIKNNVSVEKRSLFDEVEEAAQAAQATQAAQSVTKKAYSKMPIQHILRDLEKEKQECQENIEKHKKEGKTEYLEIEENRLACIHKKIRETQDRYKAVYGEYQ